MRTSDQYRLHHELGEKAWLKEIMDIPLTENEQLILEHNALYNIHNVTNELHVHFDYGNRDLFQSCPFDTLHTVLKGLLQECFMWTLAVIKMIGALHPKFSNNLAVLDDRIINFQRIHSINPVGDHLFREGMSRYVVEKTTTNLGKGHMNATKLEAQKIPSAIFQLMLSIGKP